MRRCCRADGAVDRSRDASGSCDPRRQPQGHDDRSKLDGSPATEADFAADRIIGDGLARLVPDVPALSEERVHLAKPPFRGSLFLIDPLDGTKEFVASRGEFTVNLALVTNGTPLLGIIGAPALGWLWRGLVGRGAERLRLDETGKGRPEPIHTRPLPKPGEPWVAAVSRSHGDVRTEAFVGSRPGAIRKKLGSALKFGSIAEGKADIYPRLAPTSEWDIAAGHAVGPVVVARWHLEAIMNISTVCSALVLGGLVAMTAPSTVSRPSQTTRACRRQRKRPAHLRPTTRRPTPTRIRPSIGTGVIGAASIHTMAAAAFTPRACSLHAAGGHRSGRDQYVRLLWQTTLRSPPPCWSDGVPIDVARGFYAVKMLTRASIRGAARGTVQVKVSILTEQPTPELSCTSVPCLSHCQAQLRIVRCVRAMP